MVVQSRIFACPCRPLRSPLSPYLPQEAAHPGPAGVAARQHEEAARFARTDFTTDPNPLDSQLHPTDVCIPLASAPLSNVAAATATLPAPAPAPLARGGGVGAAEGGASGRARAADAYRWSGIIRPAQGLPVYIPHRTVGGSAGSAERGKGTAQAELHRGVLYHWTEETCHKFSAWRHKMGGKGVVDQRDFWDGASGHRNARKAEVRAMLQLMWGEL